MTAAKKKEIRNLLKRKTFKIILKEDILPYGNVLPGRFVLAIKSSITGEVVFKARYVIGGHRDKLKHMMVHSSTTMQPSSVRLLLALARIFGFDVWTSDVTQAYLQSILPLSREIFIKNAAPEFELDPDQCLQLLKPLYGLCESGDLWHATMDEHHRKDLGMTPLRSDPALYCLLTDHILTGLSGGYVDDLIRTGDDSFREKCKLTHKKFEMKPDSALPSEYAGFQISKDGDALLIDQLHYLRKLEALPLDATFGDFRSARMKLAWLAHTRPDCLFHISQLAQVTSDRFESDKRNIIKQYNLAAKLAKEQKYFLRTPHLNREPIRVVGFSDASFANNHDLSSQLGYIIMLVDDTGTMAPIHFKSYKARRIARSAMAAEVIAFSDMSDVAVTLSSEISLLLGRQVPVQLLTDNKSLFDVISKGSRTSEKRIMLDIAAAREGFRDHVISDIGFVRSNHNLADGLTKHMSQASLIQAMRSCHVDINPEQWIIRPKQ